jgi:hypothetical protein
MTIVNPATGRRMTSQGWAEARHMKPTGGFIADPSDDVIDPVAPEDDLEAQS